MTEQRFVRVGVGVMVLTPAGYVLIKRKGSHGEGEWSFPGGHLEFGESVEDCGRREVMEELGVELSEVRVLGCFTEDQFPGKHYITLYVIGKAVGEPRIIEPDKASDICFVTSTSVGDLPTPLFGGVAEAYKWVHCFHAGENLHE